MTHGSLAEELMLTKALDRDAKLVVFTANTTPPAPTSVLIPPLRLKRLDKAIDAIRVHRSVVDEHTLNFDDDGWMRAGLSLE